MAESPGIRVMVVDDQALARGGLRYFLLAVDDIELVAETDNSEAALALCGEANPDVVLLELAMAGLDGVTTIRAIRQRYPEVQVVILTGFSEQKQVQQALRAGAIGYLLKDVSIDELIEAIRAAHAGRPTLAPQAAWALIEQGDPALEVGQNLSARQKEVLTLVVEGMSNVEIAGRLGVSVSTARHHVSEILTRLGAHNRAEAAALAVQHNLVEKRVNPRPAPDDPSGKE